MEATTLNPFFASSIAVSMPMPLDEPVTIAILSAMFLKDGTFVSSHYAIHNRSRPSAVVWLQICSRYENITVCLTSQVLIRKQPQLCRSGSSTQKNEIPK